jgi:hypothetical protein
MRWPGGVDSAPGPVDHLERIDMTQHTTTSGDRKPTAPNTCSGCDATWTGVAVCHCSGCHTTWSGISLFDAHRRGGQCVAAQALDRDLRLVAGVWRSPEMTDEARALFAS